MSVHLQKFPDLSEIPADANLVWEMDLVRLVCSHALSIRKKHNIRVRCPIASLKIISLNAPKLSKYSALIKDELNVKNIEFEADVEKHATKTVNILFAKCGKRIKSYMKDVLDALKKEEYKIVNGKLEIGGQVLEKDEYEINLKPILQDSGDKFDFSLTPQDDLVILDLEISEDLEMEALSRDFIRLIQNYRKEQNLNVSDKITLYYHTKDEGLIKSLGVYKDFILSQVMGVDLIFCSNELANTMSLDDINFSVEIQKV